MSLLLSVSVFFTLVSCQSDLESPDGTYKGNSGKYQGTIHCENTKYGSTDKKGYFNYFQFNGNDLHSVQFTLCSDDEYTDFKSGLSLWKYNGEEYDMIISSDDSTKCGFYGPELVTDYFYFNFAEYSYCLVDLYVFIFIFVFVFIYLFIYLFIYSKNRSCCWWIWK